MSRNLLALSALSTLLGFTWLASFNLRFTLLSALVLHGLAAAALAAFHLRIKALDRGLNPRDRASLHSAKATRRVRWVQFAGIILLMLALAADNQPPGTGPLLEIWLAIGFNLGALLALAFSLIGQTRLLAEMRSR